MPRRIRAVNRRVTASSISASLINPDARPTEAWRTLAAFQLGAIPDRQRRSGFARGHDMVCFQMSTMAQQSETT